mmetsp:Transcript_10510/g.15904  ORF Transcript_10510/g.15904 Transcript_10510/m.15904 type:complete len:80 (-) Transcript_10510:92-331(-)
MVGEEGHCGEECEPSAVVPHPPSFRSFGDRSRCFAGRMVVLGSAVVFRFYSRTIIFGGEERFSVGGSSSNRSGQHPPSF